MLEGGPARKRCQCVCELNPIPEFRHAVLLMQFD
jgi:hypothetical protein